MSRGPRAAAPRPAADLCSPGPGRVPRRVIAFSASLRTICSDTNSRSSTAIAIRARNDLVCSSLRIPRASLAPRVLVCGLPRAADVTAAWLSFHSIGISSVSQSIIARGHDSSGRVASSRSAAAACSRPLPATRKHYMNPRLSAWALGRHMTCPAPSPSSSPPPLPLPPPLRAPRHLARSGSPAIPSAAFGPSSAKYSAGSSVGKFGELTRGSRSRLA